MLPTPQRVMDRFWDRVDVRTPDECWLWKLSVGNHTYGQVGWQDPNDKHHMRLAHRVAWEIANGPIPGALTVDHICRVHTCCNPAHLRLLTNSENASNNAQALQTHCVHGHEFTPENIRPRLGKHGRRTGRSCRACDAIRNAARKTS